MTQAGQEQAPSPDQNDPTGHSRPGSPSYRPEAPPSNNQRPHTEVRSPRATDEYAEEEAKLSNKPISSSASGGAAATPGRSDSPNSDPQRRPDPNVNPQTDKNEGQEIHLKWDEHGHGRPGMNQAAEDELEKTAKPDDGEPGKPAV